jgi:hypothetical protein
MRMLEEVGHRATGLCAIGKNIPNKFADTHDVGHGEFLSRQIFLSKWVDRHHEVFKAREKACTDDKKKFCAKHTVYAEVEKCLSTHMGELAGDCKATFSK